MTRRIFGWVRLLTGMGIIALLVRRLGSDAFLDGLRIIDGRTLVITFLLGVTTTVFSAWRWCLVARGLGLRLRLRSAIADYYQALLLNATLPGGVLGDVDRAVQHGRGEGDIGRGVRAVVWERMAGQLVLAAAGLGVLAALPSPVSHLFTAYGMTAALALGAVGVVVALAYRWRRGSSTAASVTRRSLAEIRTGVLRRGTWPGVLLSSAVVLAGHLATFLVAARAAGSTASLGQLLPLMMLALLAMSLPLNVGGWGPREGVTAWAFGAAGLSAHQGLTIAVAYGVFAFVAALPGVAVLLSRALPTLRARRVAVGLPVDAAATAPAAIAVVPAVPAHPVRELAPQGA